MKLEGCLVGLGLLLSAVVMSAFVVFIYATCIDAGLPGPLACMVCAVVAGMVVLLVMRSLLSGVNGNHI